MKIVVCVKQVPETSDVKTNLETGSLIREGAGVAINPFDEFAVEEAVRTKEKYGGSKVIAISMGPVRAGEVLKKALAMGADEAYLISHKSFAGSDTLATSYILAEVVKKIGDVDLIFAGKQAIDGDTGQVGPGIACRLGFSPITYVSKIREIDLKNKTVTAERFLEDGIEVVQFPIPAVITVMKNINTPRIPSIMAILKASKKEIETLGPEDIPGLDMSKIGLNGSPTSVKRIFPPETKGKKAEIFTGEISQAVSSLADRLMKSGAIR